MIAFFAAAAVIFLVAVTSLGSTLNSVLGETEDVAAMDAERLGLSPSTAAVAPPSSPDPVRKAAADAPVIPAKAAVFSPDGSPDTGWSTDRYYDKEPFPKFKEGLGLLLELSEPTALSALSIDLKSNGTIVQIRDATENPKALADTGELSAPTPLQPGPNRIELSARSPVSTVLVRISTLGATDG